MEFINYNGRHVEAKCERCGSIVMVPASERRLSPAPVTCDDCLSYLRTHPEQAQREFDAAMRRSEQDSLARRARWAAQDAAKESRTE